MSEIVITASITNWVAIGISLAGLAVAGINLSINCRIRSKKEKEAENDWKAFAKFQESGGTSITGPIFTAESGSEDHQWAERMVLKGCLKRCFVPMNYSLVE